MPFDGTYIPSTQLTTRLNAWQRILNFLYPAVIPEQMPHRILREAKALIANERHWIKGIYEATSSEGYTRRCAVGALRAASVQLNASQHAFREAYVMLGDVAMRAEIGGINFSVERANDHGSHERMLHMFDMAITRKQLSSVFRAG